MNVANEIIRHFGGLHHIRRYADIERRVGPVGALDFYDGRFDFEGQFAADLVQSIADFGERGRTRLIEFQTRGDGAEAGDAGGFYIVDAGER